jgi:hypothetical protein
VGFDLLAESGLVRCRGVVQSISCESCDEPHDAEVIFESGSYGIYCPDAGFAGLTPLSVEAVQPDIGRLVSEIADTLDCKRRKSTPVQGDTWRIGAIETPTGDLVLYFHPCLQTEQDVREVEAALLHEVGAVFRLIVTAFGALKALNATSIQLADIVEFVHGAGSLAIVADPRTVAGAPQTPKNGRPSPYADKLSSLVLRRIEDGSSLPGLNEEARAIAVVYGVKHKPEQVPSISTIKRRLTDLRAGS